MTRGSADRTAGSAAKLGLDLAGKTGTTDSYTDAWFAGYTPRYTLLVWVGYDQKRYLGRGMTGAVAALPIWRAMIERGLEEGWIDKEARFERPPGVTMRRNGASAVTASIAVSSPSATGKACPRNSTAPGAKCSFLFSAAKRSTWLLPFPTAGALPAASSM